MSLFEIEINGNFKISNGEVFLNEDELKKYYKLNNLNDGYSDDISEYLLDDDIPLMVQHDNFCIYQYRYDSQEISTIIASDLYELNKDSNEEVLYPEWLLFFIAIKKGQVSFISEDEFRRYIKHFKFIAEIRYKKYIIRNIRNYINLKEYKDAYIFQEPLSDTLSKYSKNVQYKISEMYNFLNFLYDFHYQLKEKEKYKLMWNLEVYIIETVNLLIEYNVPIDEIYKQSIRRGKAYLQNILIYKPLYIRENKNFFSPHLEKINGVLNENIQIDTLMNIFLANEKYEDILFYYMELIERLNASKISQDTMGVIIKGIVLGVEEYIRDVYECRGLYDCLKEIKPNSHEFDGLKKKIGERDSNTIFFEKFEKLILDEEDSLEKYLMLYYHSRNYLAHNNIDMTKFFWGIDGKRTVIINVLDSIMIILYKLATLEDNNKINQK